MQAEQLGQLLQKEIPLSQTMGITDFQLSSQSFSFLLPLAPNIMLIKILFAISAIAFWLWTQKLLGARKAVDPTKIQDSLLDLLAPFHQRLQGSPGKIRFLLITSSLIIDLIGAYLILSGIFGPTVRPLLGVVLLFALRQLAQASTLLPAPQGIIWKSPRFPSLFVTYDVANDFFFSGHTALAVYGALELSQNGGPLWMGLAAFVVLYEVLVVLLLRAHWTLDVFTGTLAALWIFEINKSWSPAADQWIALLQDLLPKI
jgi:hypothetical protein